MNIIEIKNLNFSYHNKKVFESLYFSLKENTMNYLTGKNLCGKTTFLKLLSGLYSSDNIDYSIDKNKISYISDIECFFSKTIYDELIIISKDITDSHVKKILSDFNLIDKINKSPLSLKYYEKYKLSIIKCILSNCKLILLDNIFSTFPKEDAINTLREVNKYMNKYDFTVIVASNDTELIFEFDHIIILDKKVVFYDEYIIEDIFLKSNLKVPFNIELSNKLNLYNLLNEDIYDLDEMVDHIC